jgi:hypothetical protein
MRARIAEDDFAFRRESPITRTALDDEHAERILERMHGR